jgi:hypothetical protein
MLARSRVSTKMDVGRLGASLARPGIDTRSWVTLAIALDESQVDEKHGVFVDVMFMPTGEKYTARVPSSYAGNGFGFYARIHKDDEVAVVIPRGNPAEGCIVIPRLWSASDLPPKDVIDNPDDIVLVIEKDKNLRLHVQGEGKVIVQIEKDAEIKVDGKIKVNCSDINLGEDSPSDKAALAQKVLDELNNLQTHFKAWEAVITGPPIPEPGNGANSALQAALLAPMQAKPYPTPGSVACQTTKVK